VDATRALLRHFLAALAYRTQKALRGAPETFPAFRAAPGVRTPRELIRHMTVILGHARTVFTGEDEWHLEPQPTFDSEVRRFHDALEELGRRFDDGTPFRHAGPEQLLQGPLADAMTHAGQLAMLRRLAGSPIPPEDFMRAAIRPDNVGPEQPAPVAPSPDWSVPT
jgi:hypothetical protein